MAEDTQLSVEQLLKQEEILKRVGQIQGANATELKEQLGDLKDVTDALTAQLGLQKQFATEKELALEANQMILAAVEEQAKLTQRLLDLQGKTTDAAEKERKVLEERLGLATASAAELQEHVDRNKENAKILADANKELKKSAGLTEGSRAATRLLAEEWLGVKDTTLDFGDLLIDAALKGGSVKDIIGGVASEMKKMMTAATALKTIKNHLKDMGAGWKENTFGAQSLNVQMDELDIRLTRATGATEEMGAEAKNLRHELLKQGYVMEEVEGAFGTLITSSSVFAQKDADVRAGMMDTAVVLGRFGVSADTFGESVDSMTLALGETPAAAGELTKELTQFGRAMAYKGGPNALLKDFNAQLPILARYGKKQGVEIFKQLAVTARNTGIEMGKLVAIAGQFNTFEGAAEAAGKLNMVLGGPMLNSIELLNASESERIQLLKDSMAASGKSWAEMGRFERELMAQTMGVGEDVAAKLFTNQAASIEEATAAIDGQTDSTKDLAEEAKRRRKLEEIQMSAAQKQIDANKEMNKVFVDLQRTLDKLKEKYAGVFGVIGMVVGIIGVLGNALMLLIGTFMLFKSVAVQAALAAARAFIVGFAQQVIVFAAWVAGAIMGTVIPAFVAAATAATSFFMGTIVPAAIAAAAAVGTALATMITGLVSLSIAFLTNPIGLAIMAIVAVIYLLWDNWDAVTGFMGASIDWIGEKFGQLVQGLKNMVKGILKMIVNMVAGLLTAITLPFKLILLAAAEVASYLPGGDSIAGALRTGAAAPGQLINQYRTKIIGSIEGFEAGGPVRQGGPALVGEGGPELVTLPRGSNVVTNENLEKLMSAVAKEKTGPALAKEQTVNVVLKLDTDVLAKHSAKIARDVIVQTLEFG